MGKVVFLLLCSMFAGMASASSGISVQESREPERLRDRLISVESNLSEILGSVRLLEKQSVERDRRIDRLELYLPDEPGLAEDLGAEGEQGSESELDPDTLVPYYYVH